MGWEAWITLGVVAVMFTQLAATQAGPDFILMGGLLLLLLCGIVGPAEALEGGSNEGVITIAVLFVVAAGLRETGAMTLVVDRVLNPAQSVRSALVRFMPPVAVMSGFLNNTPLVAMLLPGIADWAKKRQFAPSKLLIPLSYAAILGGLCTLIGTSTNLLVNGLLIKSGYGSLGMFDITWVGLPCAAAGVLYVLTFGTRLLPDRGSAVSETADPREYTLEMTVEPGSALVGQSIEKAGLRHLRGLYLMEIDREGQVLAAVGSQETLQANDRLVFVGDVDSIVDLQKVRGLLPAANQVFKLDAPRAERCLIEAVVSNSCPLLGKSIREGKFRSVYNAAVIAVARNGQRIRKKIGDIVLEAGDNLLLEARQTFVDNARQSRDFYLVSRIEDSTPPRHERTWIALLILTAMVVIVAARWTSMLVGGMLAAGLMLLTRCCSGEEARRSIRWRLLVSIVAAIGIGNAVQVSGAAEAIAGGFLTMAGGRPWLVLAAVYINTALFTELVTNNAAAVIIFPIAMSAAETLGVSHMPFVMAIMIAASASFVTPIGYQTNLMVYGPGGYRFSDFVRIGLPLSILIGLLAILTLPLAWEF